MKLHTFKQAEQYLNDFISKGFKYIFQGEIGLKRVKDFLKLLGDPQNKIKIIHVAGTSGKGSTCYLISSLLTPQGFKVALTLSPHLTDVRERFQIDGKMISKKEFVFYLNKIIPFIKTPLSYFEILVGLAFYIFVEKKVDYAVIETGLGGLYDATNVVSRSDKLAVLSKIGLDHTNVLGKTIEKIAYQKAMIINEKSQVISINQDPKVEEVIRKVAKNKGAKIYFVGFSSSPRRRGSRNMDSRFRGNDRVESLTKNLNLIGDYQQENAGLALSAVNYLSQRDGFIIDKIKVKKVFETAKFPGRFDIRKINNKIIIFDGAHNPQKMNAFIASLVKKYPNKKFTFLLAFKKGKDYLDMLKIMIPWAHSITLTSFSTKDQDMVNTSEDTEKIGLGLSEVEGFDNFEIDLSLKKAWEQVLKKEESIVVTGSLYLVGEIFKLIKKK